jgi:hypothetical protein
MGRTVDAGAAPVDAVRISKPTQQLAMQPIRRRLLASPAAAASKVLRDVDGKGLDRQMGDMSRREVLAVRQEGVFLNYV